jgi:hypothetical protein
VGSAGSELVEEVDEILLAEEDGDHEIGRRGGTDVLGPRGAPVTDYEGNQDGEIDKEDDRKDSAVSGKECVWERR